MARLNPDRAHPEWLAFTLGLAALLVALGAQHAGLVPCALCYVERWPYRAVIVLALLGLLWQRGRPALRPLLALCFAAAAAAALTHVGVEAHWWKSPLPECAAPPLHTGSVANLLASLPAHPSKPCDDPTYLIPGLKLSMAQMNLLFALASMLFVAISILRAGRRHDGALQ